MKRPFLIACLALLAVAFLAVSPAVEAATIQTGPVRFIADGSVVPGTHAKLIRNQDGIGLMIQTRHLPGEGALTVWMFFIHPDGTMDGPFFGSSDTAGPSGKAHFAIGRSEAAGELEDAEGDTVRAVILHHGPVDPDEIHLQLTVPPGGGPPNPVQFVMFAP